MATREVVALVTGLVFCRLGLAGPLAQGRMDERAKLPYFALHVNSVSSFSVHTTSPTLSPARIRTRPGYEIGAGIGYRFQNSRIESSLIYGRFDADSIRFAGGGGSLDGYFDLRGLTVDFSHELVTGGALRPYLGAGLGLIRFRANGVRLAGFPPTEGTNTLFAYHFSAGVAYPVGPWRFSLGYRTLTTGEQDFSTGPDSLRADPLHIGAFQAGVEVAF